MRQTLAILLDGYRELNHRKLFWFVLILSGLVVLAFAALGNDEEGLTFLHWSIPFPLVSTTFIPKADFYKIVFSQFGLGLWLSFAATIVALISTASIIPDFVDRGSIDLMLSKPIGRVRLFLTKFSSGLLFAGLQVTVFTVAAFLVIGLRAGDWEPWLFVSIPLFLLFYSYLFSMQAVVGLVTRSVIASVIVVFLFWGVLFLVQSGDGVTLMWRVTQEITTERKTERIELFQARAIEAEALRVDLYDRAADGDETAAAELPEAEKDADIRAARLIRMQDEQVEAIETLEIATRVNWWLHLANTMLPKTGETIQLLERILRDRADLVVPVGDEDNTQRQFGAMVGAREFDERMQAALGESHSALWTIGTSLVFEFFVLAFGVWWFGRRDY